MSKYAELVAKFRNEIVEGYRSQVIQAVESYLELTREPDENGSVTENLEWEAGYQAALAIMKGTK